MDHDDLKMLNCAGCGLEMLGETHAPLSRKLAIPAVYGHMRGRPYCVGCLTPRVFRPWLVPSGRGSAPDDCSPLQENAIRAMEDRDEAA